MWLICYWAPRCPMPPNPCRRFILISPLRYADHWGDGPKKEEEDDSAPWWFNLAAYSVVIACMVWPFVGWIVLFCVAMWMMWGFIQRITETGPHAREGQDERNKGDRLPSARR